MSGLSLQWSMLRTRSTHQHGADKTSAAYGIGICVRTHRKRWGTRRFEPLVRGSFEDLQELEHDQAKHDEQVAAQKDQREFGGLGHFYSGHVTPHVLARMTRPFIISL
jgi:hypothetical protein